MFGKYNGFVSKVSACMYVFSSLFHKSIKTKDSRDKFRLWKTGLTAIVFANKHYSIYSQFNTWQIFMALFL
jgi:hypothetical protein